MCQDALEVGLEDFNETKFPDAVKCAMLKLSKLDPISPLLDNFDRNSVKNLNCINESFMEEFKYLKDIGLIISEITNGHDITECRRAEIDDKQAILLLLIKNEARTNVKISEMKKYSQYMKEQQKTFFNCIMKVVDDMEVNSSSSFSLKNKFNFLFCFILILNAIK